MTTKASRVQTSLDLYEKAGQLIPGKTQLISRRASSFAHPVSPIYASSAKGSRFTDVDGNEFIDWVNCVTAVILGHADEVVDTAVKEQIDKLKEEVTNLEMSDIDQKIKDFQNKIDGFKNKNQDSPE